MATTSLRFSPLYAFLADILEIDRRQGKRLDQEVHETEQSTKARDVAPCLVHGQTTRRVVPIWYFLEEHVIQ
jgi:hypothetical protein